MEGGGLLDGCELGATARPAECGSGGGGGSCCDAAKELKDGAVLGAISGAVQGAVGGAVSGAVQGVEGGAVAGADDAAVWVGAMR